MFVSFGGAVGVLSSLTLITPTASQVRVEWLHSPQDSGGTAVAVVLPKYQQEGLHAEAVACYIKPQAADHPVVTLFRYARANPVAGG